MPSDLLVSHPPLVSALEATHFGSMEPGGGLPAGFLDYLYDKMGVTDPDQVLHLCSGTIKRGITVDIRPETGAQHICDARHTPFEDGSFRWILSDPPPFVEYNRQYYGQPEENFPEPDELMTEAARLLVPGGLFCILSLFELSPEPGLIQKAVYVPLLGPGYFVRGAFVFERVTEWRSRPNGAIRPRMARTNPKPI